jgi:hypothetical protein
MKKKITTILNCILIISVTFSGVAYGSSDPLTKAILALKIMAGLGDNVNDVDMDKNGKVDLQDAIYWIQVVAGMRCYKCDFSSIPLFTERCFGGVGPGCDGIPVLNIAPMHKDPDTCIATGYISAGSIRHDKCCFQNDNNGFACKGYPELRPEYIFSQTCKKEWDEAYQNWYCPGDVPRQGIRPWGPYLCDELGDDENAPIYLPPGTAVNVTDPENRTFCQYDCELDSEDNPIINEDNCGEYCVCADGIRKVISNSPTYSVTIYDHNPKIEAMIISMFSPFDFSREVHMILDGEEVQPLVETILLPIDIFPNLIGIKVSYTPETKLTPGTHEVSVGFYDSNGIYVYPKVWTFNVTRYYSGVVSYVGPNNGCYCGLCDTGYHASLGIDTNGNVTGSLLTYLAWGNSFHFEGKFYPPNIYMQHPDIFDCSLHINFSGTRERITGDSSCSESNKHLEAVLINDDGKFEGSISVNFTGDEWRSQCNHTINFSFE